uniref:Uncharacterized protein n=1 Tax=Triticum urartu TaxID=4572 RepID=A0A8R7RCH6_TRIUA
MLPKRGSTLGIGSLRMLDTSGVLFGGLLVHLLVFPTVLKKSGCSTPSVEENLKICTTSCKKFQHRVLCSCFTRVLLRIIFDQRRASSKQLQRTFSCCCTNAQMFIGPEELSQADWIFMEHVTDCVIAD